MKTPPRTIDATPIIDATRSHVLLGFIITSDPSVDQPLWLRWKFNREAEQPFIYDMTFDLSRILPCDGEEFYQTHVREHAAKINTFMVSQGYAAAFN